MSGNRTPEKFPSLNTNFSQVYGKLRREKASLNFSRSCILSQVTPRYVREKISKNLRSHSAFTTKKIKKMEMEILLTEIDEKVKNVKIAEMKFVELKNKLKFYFHSDADFHRYIQKVKKGVKKLQLASDLRKQVKLKNLVQARGLNRPYNKATVHNFTRLEIPASILNLLELGQKRGLGGVSSDVSNFRDIGKLFTEFQNRARQNSVLETE